MYVYGFVCDGESYELTVTILMGCKVKVCGDVEGTAVDETMVAFLINHSITER